MSTIEIFRTAVIEKVGYQADWREEKAAQYPADARNSVSASRLRELTRELDLVPATALPWARLRRAWERFGDDAGAATEIESEILRTYGFGSEGVSADKFLDLFAAALEAEESGGAGIKPSRDSAPTH